MSTTSWMVLDDAEVRHVWEGPDGRNPTNVTPCFYASSGTPVCGSDSAHEGEDMVYVRTEVGPRVAEALRFRATVEPILNRIYDAVYFDGDANRYDPDTDWDSAGDILEAVFDALCDVYAPLKRRTKIRPALKLRDPEIPCA